MTWVSHVRFRPLTSMLFGVIALLGVIGCGPALVPVTGVCKRNGKPVSHLSLVFAPKTGKPLWNATDDDGRFAFKTEGDQKGIPIGTYSVIVSFQFRTPQEEMNHLAGKFHFHPDKDIIVKKYGSTAPEPLVVEITHANQELELNLN